MRHPIALLAVFLFLAGNATPLHAEERKPNIVIILCDDLGYGDLGCFGHPEIKTPNLDQLAKDGLRLTRCYSASPVCSPSRAGMLTGRNPNRLGIRDWLREGGSIHLKKEEFTVAALLKRAGYRTAHVGKWHLNGRMDGSQPTPGDHGFDHWFSTQNNAAPSHQDPENFIRNGTPVGQLKGYSSTLIIDEALKFLGEAPEKPFAVFVWFHAPHEPIAAPDEYTGMYPNKKPTTKADYYGCVSLLDHEVGRLMKSLDEMKVRENTFVFFTSDNGPETLNRYAKANRSHGSPGPLRGMKLHIHEAGYRVPGIISWPGKTTAGSVSDEPVCGLDVLPTLCEIAGIAPPKDRALDGASFLPVLAGKPVTRSVPLYWQYDGAISKPWKLSTVDGPWKLVADADMAKFELFDLSKDLAEAKDLSGAEPERVKQMTEALRARYQEINKDTGTRK